PLISSLAPLSLHDALPILNIADTAGVETALPNRAAYCASKAGIVGFARECACEYAEYRIRVNTVLPGAFDTPAASPPDVNTIPRSEEHTSELQSRENLVCR